MKTILNISFTMLCCLFVYYTALSQNVSDELALLEKRYAQLDNYSVSLTYKAFKGHASSDVADMQYGKFEIWKGKTRFVLGNIEVVQNGAYCIQVDKNFKEMDVSRSKPSMAAPAYSNFRHMDSLLKARNALFFKQEANGIRLLIFDLKKSGEEYEKIEIRYLSSGDIVSLTLFYRAPASAYGLEEDYKPRVEITYKNHRFGAGLSDASFSENKYFNLQEGKPVPVGAFKTYQIFGQL